MKLLSATLGLAAIGSLALAGLIDSQSLLARSRQASVASATQAAALRLPSFEAASVKPDSSGDDHIDGSVGGERYRMNNVTPKYLIEYAFNLLDYQVSGGPSWLDSKRYDIDAKVDDATFASWAKLQRDQQGGQMRLAVQSLLMNRFNLRVTRETKELPVYALVVAKGGPKLNSATIPPSLLPDCPRACLSSTNSSLDNLAASLAALLRDRVVLNETGISGRYQYALHWIPQSLRPSDQSTDNSGPSIFTALEGQLGLRIEATKGPVDTIAIDHIEEPSPN
jgi:uncharacterized protein (TIGR03435 family)